MKLEDKIEQWIKDNPDRSYAGERMKQQLKRVRAEYTGADALRLEGLVEETLNRQLNIDDSRKKTAESSVRLVESIMKLRDAMEETPSTVKGIEAAAHVITSRNLSKEPNKDLSFIPPVPSKMDKTLN